MSKVRIPSIVLALVGLCVGAQLAIASGGSSTAPKKLAEGNYEIWDSDGNNTGKFLTSTSAGNNVDTTGPPAWFGQWDAETLSYDQHPGNEDLEVFPTTSPDVYTYKLKNGSGNVIQTGTLNK